jgi:aldose 1-epimerase
LPDSYFNLSGDRTIEDTRVTLPTALHLPVDDLLIPTGAIAPYPDVEANTEFTLGPIQPDIDHCFVLDPATVTPPATVPPDTRTHPLRLNAAARHPKSRVRLEVHSTEPAFQFYTGRYIDVPEVRDGAGRVVSPAREARAGFCVEPSRFVNAVNVDGWRGMVVLRRGQLYGARVVYRAWQEAARG